MDLGNFNPEDIEQHLEGVDWPADKEQVASQAESNGAPGPVVDQLRQRASGRRVLRSSGRGEQAPRLR